MTTKIKFECVKVGVRQNRDGYMLTLSLHPSDVPETIIRSWVGTRYQATLVEIGDDERPVQQKAEITKDRLIAAAAMLCREKAFWSYMMDVCISDAVYSEDDAASELRRYLGIESRSELKTNNTARETMEGIIGEFVEWQKKNTGS